MKKLIPVILALFGLAVGTGAGIFLKPAPVEEEAHTGDPSPAAAAEDGHKNAGEELVETAQEPVRRGEIDESGQDSGFEYVKLNNQFIVPVVSDNRVAALVVMSLSIEVAAGQKENIYSREPKLRDAFLQVLFDHANTGGFDGVFTTGEKMNDLRGSLFQAAVKILGPTATDVLVIDIVRQDV